MTDAEQGAALLRGVLDAPDDDLPRLVYADWLDENGQAERAEFIHLQLQIASMSCLRDKHSCRDLAVPESALCMACWNAEPLVKRAASLLDAPGAMDGAENGAVWAGWPRGFAPASHGFRRGFVEKIRCTLDAWLEHGPAIVAAHPVARVELTDKEPWAGRDAPGFPVRTWGWWASVGPGQERWRLPVSMLVVLGADRRRLMDVPVGFDAHDCAGGVFFGSPEDCADATSDALLAWAKQPPQTAMGALLKLSQEMEGAFDLIMPPGVAED